MVEQSNVKSYLNKQGVAESNEKYTEVERVFKAKTKLESWKTISQARVVLVLKLEEHIVFYITFS